MPAAGPAAARDRRGRRRRRAPSVAGAGHATSFRGGPGRGAAGAATKGAGAKATGCTGLSSKKVGRSRDNSCLPKGRKDERSVARCKLAARSCRAISPSPAIRWVLTQPATMASEVSVGAADGTRGRRSRRPAAANEDAGRTAAFLGRRRARPTTKMRCDMPLLDDAATSTHQDSDIRGPAQWRTRHKDHFRPGPLQGVTRPLRLLWHAKHQQSSNRSRGGSLGCSPSIARQGPATWPLTVSGDIQAASRRSSRQPRCRAYCSSRAGSCRDTAGGSPRRNRRTSAARSRW